MPMVELDPQIQRVLDLAAEAGTPPITEQTPEEVRANNAAGWKATFGEVDEVASVEDVDANGVPARIYRPTERKDGDEPATALVYFHGGGWVAGSVEVYDPLTRAIAKRANTVVVSVDYRLAPEHRYPAALDDAWTATRWVSDNAADLGVDPMKIGVGGDSAGGTLAAVVARKARDFGLAIATQLLIYPVMSHDFNTPSYSLFSDGYLLTREAMIWYWKQYVGEVDASSDADASPAAERDLRRLPRAIVITAEADPLRDEAEAYAQRLFISTVETEGYRYDGMVHGFLRMTGVVDRSDQAITEICESLQAALEKGYSTT